MSASEAPASSDTAAPTAATVEAARPIPPTPSGESSSFAMLGDPTAAACEGDACLIP